MGEAGSCFSKGISLKVNVIKQLEFTLAFYNVTVQYISNYCHMAYPPLDIFI